MSRPARLTWEPITIQLRNPFGLSYGVTEARRVFWLRLAGDEGWGEAAIPPYYGIPEADMAAIWQVAAMKEEPFPGDPGHIAAWIGEAGPAPARAALDLALHDRIARSSDLPLWRLLGLPRPIPILTSFTIAIATPDEMARLAEEAAPYPILKIKLGSDDDVSRLAAVRAARPDARLRVDANAGWSAQEAVERIGELERFNLELVEQPTQRDDLAGMGHVQAHTGLPVYADESVRSIADVDALAAAGVRGINLKLMKVGGLGPGLRILERAREHGMSVMLGCMIETSLGTTTAFHLSGLADLVDLDAPLLVSNDPFDGVRFSAGGEMTLPDDRPGIGALLR